jgi:hypothetical protein
VVTRKAALIDKNLVFTLFLLGARGMVKHSFLQALGKKRALFKEPFAKPPLVLGKALNSKSFCPINSASHRRDTPATWRGCFGAHVKWCQSPLRSDVSALSRLLEVLKGGKFSSLEEIMGTKVKPVQPTEIKDKKIAREVIEQIRKPIPASVYKGHEKKAAYIDKFFK